MTSQPAAEGQRWHIYQAVTKLWYVTQEVTDTGGFGVWNEETALRLKGVLNAALDTQAQAEGWRTLTKDAVGFAKHLDLISRGNPTYGRLARDWLARYDAQAALDAPRTEGKKDA